LSEGQRPTPLVSYANNQRVIYQFFQSTSPKRNERKKKHAFTFSCGKTLVGSIAAVHYKPIGVVITILEKVQGKAEYLV
jgi:hypothetical protein